MAGNTLGSDLLALLRLRIKEPTAQQFTDAELYGYMTEGYKKLLAKVGAPECTKAFSVVASQDIYRLDTADATIFTAAKAVATGSFQVLKIHDINFRQAGTLYPVDWLDTTEFAGYSGGSATETSDRPRYWTNYSGKQVIQLWPVPSTASASSTLNGAITNTATSIAVTDASSFPSKGRAVITSTGEQVYYGGKSSNTLTSVIRGDGFTTPTAGTGGDTIKFRPLEVKMSMLPLITNVDANTIFLTEFEDYEAILHYACHLCYLKLDKIEKSMAFLQLFKEQRDEANINMVLSNATRYPAIKAWDE